MSNSNINKHLIYTIKSDLIINAIKTEPIFIIIITIICLLYFITKLYFLIKNE